MWKISKSIDTIRKKIKELEDKNVIELLQSIGRNDACPERKTKMADGAEEVSFLKYNHFRRF